MKHLNRIATALALTAIVVAPSLTTLRAQDAGVGHYVITADDIYRAPNSAGVFRFLGGTLLTAPTLQTNGWGIGGGYFGTNGQALATVGANVCIFVSDSGSDDIAAFNAGGFSNPQKIGNYSDPSGSGACPGTHAGSVGRTAARVTR